MTNKVLIGKKGNIHPGYVYAAYIPPIQMVHSTFPKIMINASKYSEVGTWKEMMRNFEISKRSEKIQKIRNRINENKISNL
jgi:hypothetical protein